MNEPLSNQIQSIFTIPLANIDENTDFNTCRQILTMLKTRRDTFDDECVFQLIKFIEQHFIDKRESFNDRGCFLATALFGKDEFDAQKKKSFKLFADLLPIQPSHKSACVYPGFEEIINNETIPESTHSIYPLQKALKILQKGTEIQAIKMIFQTFHLILHRTPQRVFKVFSKEIFEQLTDLSHAELYDLQFKSLSHLISRDTDLLKKAIEKFFGSKSDVLRTFLVHSFNFLHDIINFEQKIELHLNFAERVLEDDFKMDPVTRSAIGVFVSKGMSLLNE